MASGAPETGCILVACCPSAFHGSLPGDALAMVCLDCLAYDSYELHGLRVPNCFCGAGCGGATRCGCIGECADTERASSYPYSAPANQPLTTHAPMRYQRIDQTPFPQVAQGFSREGFFDDGPFPLPAYSSLGTETLARTTATRQPAPNSEGSCPRSTAQPDEASFFATLTPTPTPRTASPFAQAVASIPAYDVFPFWLDYHADQSKSALLSNGLDKGVCLTYVIGGNLDQDLLGTGPVNHGDDDLIEATIRTMTERFCNAVCTPCDHPEALKCWDLFSIMTLLGQVLHALQDLYSHSNYVEQEFARRNQCVVPGEIPIWDMFGGKPAPNCKCDGSPANMDPENAPIRPPGVETGFYPDNRTPEGRRSHGDLNKDRPNSPASLRLRDQNCSFFFYRYSGFELASDLASRHSSALVESFIRQLERNPCWKELLARCCRSKGTTSPKNSEDDEPRVPD